MDLNDSILSMQECSRNNRTSQSSDDILGEDPNWRLHPSPPNAESSDSLNGYRDRLEGVNHASNTVPKSPEIVRPEKKERCAVCLGSLAEATSLESCDHSFCYACIRRWLLHCEASSCPLCKKPITFLVRTFGKSREKTQRISIDTLQDELIKERRIVKGNGVPLTNERMLLHRRSHDIKSFITRLDNSGSYKGDHSSRITDLNALSMLMTSIDDRSITRAQLVSDPKFRQVVYCMDVVSYLVDPQANPQRRNFTVSYCLSNLEESRNRVIPFIMHEFRCISPLLKGELTKTERGLKILADQIMDLCCTHQIMSPPFKLAIHKMGILVNICDRFQHELFEFASSQLPLEDYWNIVGYRSKDARIPRTNAGNNLVPPIPVVILDDSEIHNEEDDVLIIESSNPSGDRQFQQPSTSIPRDRPSDRSQRHYGRNNIIYGNSLPSVVDAFGHEGVVRRDHDSQPDCLTLSSSDEENEDQSRRYSMRKRPHFDNYRKTDRHSSQRSSNRTSGRHLDGASSTTETTSVMDSSMDISVYSDSDNGGRHSRHTREGKDRVSSSHYRRKVKKRIDSCIRKGDISKLQDWKKWLRAMEENIDKEIVKTAMPN